MTPTLAQNPTQRLEEILGVQTVGPNRQRAIYDQARATAIAETYRGNVKWTKDETGPLTNRYRANITVLDINNHPQIVPVIMNVTYDHTVTESKETITFELEGDSSGAPTTPVLQEMYRSYVRE